MIFMKTPHTLTAVSNRRQSRRSRSHCRIPALLKTTTILNRIPAAKLPHTTIIMTTTITMTTMTIHIRTIFLLWNRRQTVIPLHRYADYNNDGSVSSAPNELYDVSKSVDTNELDASDWEMALDFSGSMDGTNDFNFIKNNKSADDETTFQWMLYLGVAMIVGAVIGVICVVFTCINKRRKMLAAASGGRRGRLQGKAPSKTIYQPKKNKLQKYDTAEIDIDLGADRKDR